MFADEVTVPPGRYVELLLGFDEDDEYAHLRKVVLCRT